MVSETSDKSAQKYFGVGLLVALFALGLPLIGVTVSLWLGGFVLAGAFGCLVRAFWIWERASRFRVWFRIATVFLMGVIYFGVVGRQMLAEHRIERTPKETNVAATKEEAQTVLVRYTPMLGLPLSVPPGGSYYILQLNPKISDGLFEISNSGPKSLWWPRKPPGKAERPLDQIHACQFTNYGSKALLDVVVVFHITFYSVKEGQGKFTKNGKQSSLSVTLPKEELPSSNKGRHISKMAASEYWGGKVRSIVPDEVVSSHDHTAVIPSIPANDSATIYVVNQSKLFVSFELPTKGNSIVAGYLRKQPMFLIRPQTTVLDTVSDWMLLPSTYHWVGVPAT